MTQPAPTLILDACCLINLYATGRLREIASVLPFRLAAADYVLEREALSVWTSAAGNDPPAQEPLDLSQLLDERLLAVERIELPEEEALFVDLAADVDDGEAVTGALALHRRYALATDDRKARRVLSERDPSLPLVSTPELVRDWAERSALPAADLRGALDAIRSRASYVPAERDPLYQWWRHTLRGG